MHATDDCCDAATNEDHEAIACQSGMIARRCTQAIYRPRRVLHCYSRGG